jgi:hypothetical protein
MSDLPRVVGQFPQHRLRLAILGYQAVKKSSTTSEGAASDERLFGFIDHKVNANLLVPFELRVHDERMSISENQTDQRSMGRLFFTDYVPCDYDSWFYDPDKQVEPRNLNARAVVSFNEVQKFQELRDAYLAREDKSDSLYLSIEIENRTKIDDRRLLFLDCGVKFSSIAWSVQSYSGRVLDEHIDADGNWRGFVKDFLIRF